MSRPRPGVARTARLIGPPEFTTGTVDLLFRPAEAVVLVGARSGSRGDRRREQRERANGSGRGDRHRHLLDRQHPRLV